MGYDLRDLTVRRLAATLNLSEDTLLAVCRDAHRQYRRFPGKKKSGSVRWFEAPAPQLKNLQRLLLDRVLVKLPVHPKLFGGPHTSTKQAMSCHVRKHMVVTIDIEDFFPSVRAAKIRSAFIDHGADPDVAKILTDLVSRNGHLPQGPPTSPCVGRLVLSGFASELEHLLRKVHPNCDFSIYGDDITVSGPTGVKRLRILMYKMLRRHGFRPKMTKTRAMSRGAQQASLNIRLNRGIEPTREYLHEVEEMAKKLPSSDRSLQGKKAYIRFLLGNKK